MDYEEAPVVEPSSVVSFAIDCLFKQRKISLDEIESCENSMCVKIESINY